MFCEVRGEDDGGAPPPAPAPRVAGVTRGTEDSGPDFKNYDFFRAQFPESGRGVHARPFVAGKPGRFSSEV